MSTKITEIKPIEYWSNDKIIQFNKPLIMAIINLTPDSFYDGGKYGAIEDLINDVDEKIKLGAAIIDLGAVSTRPGAEAISDEEEWKRLSPALVSLRKTFPKIIISVDTYRAVTAKKAVAEGADMINDIGGGKLDPTMLASIAKLNIPYVLMHIQGTPQTMQINPQYKNVVEEVLADFTISVQKLRNLNFNKIILDPGFGFGKTLEHNYLLLKHLNVFEELNLPVLAGLSRKSMINKVIGSSAVTALNGTTTLNTIALLNGASILRVHDVQEARQAIELQQFYKNV